MPSDQIIEIQSMGPVLSLGRKCVLILQLPFRLIWNLIVVITAVSLTITWIGFIFGSVVGVVLMLIYFPTGFFLPMGLLLFLARLWPVE